MNKYTVFFGQTATGFSAHFRRVAPRLTVWDEFASTQHLPIALAARIVVAEVPHD
jgi:hypothetical protein